MSLDAAWAAAAIPNKRTNVTEATKRRTMRVFYRALAVGATLEERAMTNQPVNNRTRRRWRPRIATLGAALIAALALGACTLPAPPGNAPLRYRDQVFNNVDVTSGIPYGSAPDSNGNPVTLTLDLYQP